MGRLGAQRVADVDFTSDVSDRDMDAFEPGNEHIGNGASASQLPDIKSVSVECLYLKKE